jgi:hypothetical protein
MTLIESPTTVRRDDETYRDETDMRRDETDTLVAAVRMATDPTGMAHALAALGATVEGHMRGTAQQRTMLIACGAIKLICAALRMAPTSAAVQTQGLYALGGLMDQRFVGRCGGNVVVTVPPVVTAPVNARLCEVVLPLCIAALKAFPTDIELQHQGLVVLGRFCEDNPEHSRLTCVAGGHDLLLAAFMLSTTSRELLCTCLDTLPVVVHGAAQTTEWIKIIQELIDEIVVTSWDLDSEVYSTKTIVGWCDDGTVEMYHRRQMLRYFQMGQGFEQQGDARTAVLCHYKSAGLAEAVGHTSMVNTIWGDLQQLCGILFRPAAKSQLRERLQLYFDEQGLFRGDVPVYDAANIEKKFVACEEAVLDVMWMQRQMARDRTSLWTEFTKRLQDNTDDATFLTVVTVATKQLQVPPTTRAVSMRVKQELNFSQTLVGFNDEAFLSVVRVATEQIARHFLQEPDLATTVRVRVAKRFACYVVTRFEGSDDVARLTWNNKEVIQLEFARRRIFNDTYTTKVSGLVTRTQLRAFVVSVAHEVVHLLQHLYLCTDTGHGKDFYALGTNLFGFTNQYYATTAIHKVHDWVTPMTRNEESRALSLVKAVNDATDLDAATRALAALGRETDVYLGATYAARRQAVLVACCAVERVGAALSRWSSSPIVQTLGLYTLGGLLDQRFFHWDAVPPSPMWSHVLPLVLHALVAFPQEVALQRHGFAALGRCCEGSKTNAQRAREMGACDLLLDTLQRKWPVNDATDALLWTCMDALVTVVHDTVPSTEWIRALDVAVVGRGPGVVLMACTVRSLVVRPGAARVRRAPTKRYQVLGTLFANTDRVYAVWCYYRSICHAQVDGWSTAATWTKLMVLWAQDPPLVPAVGTVPEQLRRYFDQQRLFLAFDDPSMYPCLGGSPPVASCTTSCGPWPAAPRKRERGD